MKIKINPTLFSIRSFFLLGLLFTWFIVSCITNLEDLSQEEVACLQTNEKGENCIDLYYPECNRDNKNFERISRSECISKALEKKDSILAIGARQNAILDSLKKVDSEFALKQPVPSETGGFKEKSFFLRFEFPTSDPLYYEMGSNPTSPGKQSKLFLDSVLVNESVTIRILAINERGQTSKETVLNYSFNSNYTDTLIFSHPSGTYFEPFYLKINSINSQKGDIRYTYSQTLPSIQSPIIREFKDSILIDKITGIMAMKYEGNTPVTKLYYQIYNMKTQEPSSSPAPGQYTSQESIHLSSKTQEAQIYFTRDNSTPSIINSTIYNGIPLPLNSDLTIKAFAQRINWLPSDTISFPYLFSKPGETPRPFTEKISGLYDEPFSLTFIQPNKSLKIFYNVNTNKIPDSTSIFYDGKPITIDSNTNLKCIAYLNGKPSDTIGLNYEVRTPTPEVTPPDTNSFLDSVEVNIGGGDSRTLYYYTLNNTVPKLDSTNLFSNPFKLERTDTLRAVAKSPNKAVSKEVQAIYRVRAAGTAETPTFNTKAGVYLNPFQLTLEAKSPNSIIYYTQDGTTPTTNSPTYSKPIAIQDSTEIRAIAIAPGLKPSLETWATYTVKITAPIPSIPSNSAVRKDSILTLSTSTAGAIIRYSLVNDSVGPSQDIFPDSLKINGEITLYVRAFKSKMVASDVVTLKYRTVSTVQVEDVEPSKPGTTYFDSVKVFLKTKTLDAEIRYTTNGNEPTENDLKFSDTLEFKSNTTLRAKAFKKGLNSSSTLVQEYKIKTGPPQFDKDGNTPYFEKVSVGFKSVPSGKIYYSIGSPVDLKVPKLYTSPINLDTTATIYAIRVVDGQETSSSVQRTFTIKSSKPTVSPTSRIFGNSVVVSIVPPNTSSRVFYTIDKSLPSDTSKTSRLFKDTITILTSTVLKVRTYRNATLPSDVDTYEYTYQPSGTWDLPTFNKSSGTYLKPFGLIFYYPPGGTCRYALGGTAPSASSTPCPTSGDSILITKNTFVKAYVFGQGKLDGGMANLDLKVRSNPPTITQSSGPFYDSLKITLSAPNAKIYYTTNGSEPSTASTLYNTAFPIFINTKIKAIAVEPDKLPSLPDSVTYTKVQKPKWADPILTKDSIVFNLTDKFFFSWDQAAKCYYTINNTVPTQSSTLCPSNGLLASQLSKNTTIKAITIGPGKENSSVQTRQYRIRVDKPVVTPSRNFTNSMEVKITHSDTGAKLFYYYTNANPRAEITYTTPIIIDKNTQISAFARKLNLEQSYTGNETYTRIDPPSPTILLNGNLDSGAYNEPIKVTISYQTGLTCRFTIDGSNPSFGVGNSCPAGPIEYTSSTKLKVRTFSSSGVPSNLSEQNFIIRPPMINLNSTATDFKGTLPVYLVPKFISSQSKIIYTLDDSEPTESSFLEYSGQILLSKTTKIRARGYTPTNEPGFRLSAETQATYTLLLDDWKAPTFSVNGTLDAGAYNQPVKVAFNYLSAPSCAYTIDGSDPKITGITCPNSPLEITSSVTIKAYAFGIGGNNSVVTDLPIYIRPPQINFNQASSSFQGSFQVKLSKDYVNPASQIIYTTDGSEPTPTNHKVYTDSFPITTTTTIKARGYNPNNPGGYILSSVKAETYTLQLVGWPSPTFEVSEVPELGAFNKPVDVSIKFQSGLSCAYTLDGSAPTTIGGTDCPVGPITLNSTTTLKAIAYGFGGQTSNITSQIFTIRPSAVNFSPNSKAFSNTQEVKITKQWPDVPGKIVYTTDGTEPTESSPEYTTSLYFYGTTTLRARGVNPSNEPNFRLGAESQATYTLELPNWPSPTFSAPGMDAGAYNGSASVTINFGSAPSCAYTLDGSNPKITGGLPCPSGPITITSTDTLMAYAYGSGGNLSNVAKQFFIIRPSQVSFNSTSNVFSDSIEVKLSNSQGQIIYTTDDSDPSENSPNLYTGKISLYTSATIKARGYNPNNPSGFRLSAMTQETYTLQLPKWSLPQISISGNKVGGAFEGPVQFSIFSDAPRCSYTTDGSDPRVGGGLRCSSTPSNLNSTSTIKAYADGIGGTSSDLAEESFFIYPPEVTINPSSTSFPELQYIKLFKNHEISQSEIRYTTDGSVPNENSPLYIDQITIDKTTTIRARGYSPNNPPAYRWSSNISEAKFTLQEAWLAPIFDSESGVYSKPHFLTISSSEGGDCRYTDDFTEPNEFSNSCDSKIKLTETTTIKAKIFGIGKTPSATIEHEYVIEKQGGKDD